MVVLVTVAVCCTVVSLYLLRENRRLRRLAYTDPVTGLLNRQGLFMVVRQLTNGDRIDLPFALAYIDLDGFKSVNDRLGHERGDELLRVVAEELRKWVRDTDTVVRMSGDEFVVLCPGTTELGAEQMLNRIRSRLEQCDAVQCTGCEVSYSFGVVAAGPEHPTVETLLRDADKKMYEDKQRRKR